MNPAIAANQQRLFLAFLAELRPHLRRDSGLPRRLKEIFSRNRALGSRDRKLYRELVFTAVRFLPWVEAWLDTDPDTAARVIAWLAPELKPTTHFRAALCGDWPAVPATLAGKASVLATRLGRTLDPQDLLPAWFREHCPAAFTSPHLDSLNSRAGVWVRIQCHDRNLALDEFRAQRWEFEISAEFPDAICLPPNAEVANTDAYRRGFIEIQDLGSQLVLAHATVAPGSRWLDACAGAGGKTLQLARLIGEGGQVDATDIRLDILEELRDRATRARLTNVKIGPTPAAAGAYDGVLVDAPCSGSGTWRRQPHLKWYVKPSTIAEFTRLQGQILDFNAPHVRPGGLLVYATCSLSHHENQDVVTRFLANHPEFVAEPPARNVGGIFDGQGTALLPGTLNTDGFYTAALRKHGP